MVADRRALIGLLLLGSSTAVDGALVGVAAAPGASSEGAHSERAADVRDTHRRLARIYRRLGIEQRPRPPSGGCAPGGERAAPGSSSIAAVPSWLGYALIGAAAAGVLLALVAALRTRLRDDPGRPVSARAALQPPGRPRGRAPAAWTVSLSDCRALAGRGELARAVAALHRYSLLRLAERGELRLTPQATNWQLVDQLAAKPALRQLVARLTTAAERAVLGGRVPDGDEYAALERALQEQLA